MSDLTKKTLANSLSDLLIKKPLNKITITEIAEECGLNRMTFYYHFSDIIDLIEWTFIDGLKQALEAINNYGTWEDEVRKVFEGLYENKEFIINIYHSVSGNQVEIFLYKVIYNLMINVVEVYSKGMNISDKDKLFIADFYKFAFAGLIVDWIKNDMQEDPYIKEICKRDPLSGKVVTGGIVTAMDSGWLLSWTINRQPQFRSQPKGQVLVWLYGMYSDRPGDYTKKPMRDCTGIEICEEWLYHIGVPIEEITELARNSANTVPVMMPFASAYFQPRGKGDRPDVVPEGCVNFAFLGNFAETPRDTVFTTEYSIRTAMEAVYTLLDIDRGVPEVWGSVYDIRELLNAAVEMRDGKPITEMKMHLKDKIALKALIKETKSTEIEKLLKEYHVI